MAMREHARPPRGATGPCRSTRSRRRCARPSTTGEDARFWTHGGIDYQEVRHALGYRRTRFAWDSARDRQELRRVLGDGWQPAGGAPWGQHHHPAGGQEPVPLALAESAPEAEGGGHRVAAGAGPRQAADPRALPQHRRAGRRDLGRRGGEPAVLQPVGPPAHRDPGRRARGHAAVPAQVQPRLSAQPHAAAPGPDPPAHARRADRGAAGRGGAAAAAGRHDPVDARASTRCSTRSARRWRRCRPASSTHRRRASSRYPQAPLSRCRQTPSGRCHRCLSIRRCPPTARCPDRWPDPPRCHPERSEGGMPPGMPPSRVTPATRPLRPSAATPAATPAPPGPPPPPRHPCRLRSFCRELPPGLGAALRQQQRRDAGAHRQADQRGRAPLPPAPRLPAVQLALHPRRGRSSAPPRGNRGAVPPTTSRVLAPSAGANSSADPAPTASASQREAEQTAATLTGRRPRDRSCQCWYALWPPGCACTCLVITLRKLQRCPPALPGAPSLRGRPGGVSRPGAAASPG